MYEDTHKEEHWTSCFVFLHPYHKQELCKTHFRQDSIVDHAGNQLNLLLEGHCSLQATWISHLGHQCESMRSCHEIMASTENINVTYLDAYDVCLDM